MGTKKLEKQYAELWARSQLETYSNEQIIKRLARFRTFYVMAWEHCLETGAVSEAGQFYSMVDRITRLFVDIESEKADPGTVVAQTMIRHPLMLAPMEDLDFAGLATDAEPN
jgi:hypothetical protein